MNHEAECGCGHHGHEENPEMCCGHEEFQGHHGHPGGHMAHHGADCGCGHGGGMRHGHGEFMQRRFISKEEIVAKLQEYLKQLQAEVVGVEERIAELTKEG